MKRKKKRMASLLVVFVVFAFAVQAYGNVLYFDKGTKYGFSEETESIVEAHMEEFNYDSFDDFRKKYGGAENYVRSLGGVFEKYCGKDVEVRTAGEFQEVAEYVMGLMAIWGVDYNGGSGFIESFSPGRFYEGHKTHHKWKLKTIEDVFFRDKDHIVTDCGCGVSFIMEKAGLLDAGSYSGENDIYDAIRRVNMLNGGGVIRNKDELHVGDLIQMSKTEHEEGWGHVCVVGEIYPDGTVIVYETGSLYVKTGNYKKVLVVNVDGTLGGDYSDYKSWFGMRLRALD